MIGALKPNHFIHIVFDNKVHESVGGQPISNVSIRYDDLFRSMGYSEIFNVASKVDLVNALTSSKNQEKLTAIIIETKNFSDEGLERPKGDPAEWKLNFMSKVSEQKF
jgi:phosphonopyruvate decarboxylase